MDRRSFDYSHPNMGKYVRNSDIKGWQGCEELVGSKIDSPAGAIIGGIAAAASLVVGIISVFRDD